MPSLQLHQVLPHPQNQKQLGPPLHILSMSSIVFNSPISLLCVLKCSFNYSNTIIEEGRSMISNYVLFETRPLVIQMNYLSFK